MREAVIVSYARTPIGLAFKGGLNNIKSPTLAAHAISAAIGRAGIDPGEVEDLVMGTVLTAGTAAMNLGRLAALAAGLPVSVSGQTGMRSSARSMSARAAPPACSMRSTSAIRLVQSAPSRWRARM